MTTVSMHHYQATAPLHPTHLQLIQVLLRKCERRQVRLREVAVVRQPLLLSHAVRAQPVLVPEPSLLHHLSLPPLTQQRYLHQPQQAVINIAGSLMTLLHPA